MNLLNIIKLAKIMSKLKAIDSDQGPITIEDIEVGAEVYVEDAEGNTIIAADGEYVIDEGKRKLTVKDGKIESIEDVVEEVPENNEGNENNEENNVEGSEPSAISNEGEGSENGNESNENNEEGNNEPNVDELNARISELEDLLSQRDAEISSLKEEIDNLKSAPVDTNMNKVTPKSPFKTYNH